MNDNPPLFPNNLASGAAPADPPGDGKPWGLWATLAFCLLLALANIVVEGLVILVCLFEPDFELPMGDARQLLSDPRRIQFLATNGTFVAFQTVATGIVLPALCILFASLRQRISVRDYLGLREVNWSTLLKWLGVSVLLAGILEGLSWIFGGAAEGDYMMQVYVTARFKALLWLGVVLGAPLAEEFLFRGFLFAGIRNSRLGDAGAVIASAVAWTALHLQYGWHGKVTILLLGLVFGYARVRSSSLWIPLAMHAANNLFAMLQVAVSVQFLA